MATPLLNTAVPNLAPVAVPGVAQASGGVSPQGTMQGAAPAQPINSPTPQLAQPNVGQIITQARQQGVPDEQIFNALHQQGMIPTNAVSQDSGPGLFQSLVQGVASPFLKTATSLIDAGAATRDFINSGGKDNAQAGIDLQTPIDYGYFGKVAPFSANPGQGFREAAGAGLEMGSWFLGTGEADALKTATSVLAKAKLGAKVGAVIGGTQGLGAGLQDPNATIGSVAASTLEGTGGGAVGGAILTPAISKAVDIFTGKSANLAEQAASKTPDINPDGSTSEGFLTKMARQQVQNEWRDALNLPNSVTNKEAKSGKDVVQLLTDAHMKPDDIVDGRLSTKSNQIEATQHALVADKALGVLLSTEPKVVPASDYLTAALSELKSKGSDLDAAKLQVQKQLSAFIKQQADGIMPGAADGGMQMNLTAVNDVKGNAWTQVVDFADPAKTVKNDANSAIARAGKKLIEQNVTDINIKDLNSHIGDWWHALEVLQARDGAKVAGRGLTKLVRSGIGAVAGTILSHGVGGTFIGGIAGEKVSAFMTDSLLPMDLKMMLLRKLEGDPETASIVKEAWDLINKRTAEAAGRLQLPAPGKVMDAANVPPGMQGTQPQFHTGGKDVIMASPPAGPNPKPYIPNFKYRPPRDNLDMKKIPKVKLP